MKDQLKNTLELGKIILAVTTGTTDYYIQGSSTIKPKEIRYDNCIVYPFQKTIGKKVKKAM